MKGQSSLEFLAYVAISSLILAVLHGVMVDRQTEAVDYQVERDADQVLEKVSFEVEMALVQGDGYSRVFTLPNRIGGKNYQVRLLDGASVLDYGEERLISSTRYRGDEVAVHTDDTNVFRVVNDGGDVRLTEE